MDPLSQLLILLNPRTYNCGGLDLSVTSAIQFPRHKGMKCYAVVSGESWLAVEGSPDVVRLEAGHCFLLPSGRPFRLSGAPERIFDSYTDAGVVQCGTISSYNDGGGCLIVGAHYVFAGMQAVMLLGLLPPIVHLKNPLDNRALCWTLERMAEELRDPQPGGVVVAHSLAKMMLVQALRLHLEESTRDDLGGLSALSDQQMSIAITCMHNEPARAWTVEELSQRVGMSRSAFSQKFKDTVRQSPIEYLTRWRMLLAEDQINNTTHSIAEIAQSLGYESASAFTKVFKKLTGYSPRQYRQGKGTGASL